MPDVINEETKYNNYILCASNIAGTRKQLRPFNSELFIRNSNRFKENYDRLTNILNRLQKGERTFTPKEYDIVDSVIYSI